MTTASVPVSIDDPINTAILSVSEDQLTGFQRDPFASIAERTDLDEDVVIARLRAMLEAGVIRRVCQTLITTNLADGALVAWRIPPRRVGDAFDRLTHDDPFTGHVVIRAAEPGTPGASYRLWTTVKVPQGFSLRRHTELLADWVGASDYCTMPARAVFKLGVGHLRRRGLTPGARTRAAATAMEPRVVPLSPLEWRVLPALMREFRVQEMTPRPWTTRASELGMGVDAFAAIAEDFDSRGLVGRFATVLEHAKAVGPAPRVARCTALMAWAVPEGMEFQAGAEIGRHKILTHAYWRESSPELGDLNLFGVAHAPDEDAALAHKQAIDEHLRAAGIPTLRSGVFWSIRSAVRPSEILPSAYDQWCRSLDIDPKTMRAGAQATSADSGRRRKA